LIALVRADPDKYNCATPPIGSLAQLQFEVLKFRENLPKVADVAFKGGGDAIAALLAGTTQFYSGSLPPALPHVASGALRCLAVSSRNRWPTLPDVPTMEEAGYADFVFAADCLLLAPFQVQAAGARDTWARVTKEIAFFKGIIEKAGIPRL
jgi:tripartite-type tricarboxylate transporter receptor subunit TctC